jgi:hypothetical protein
VEGIQPPFDSSFDPLPLLDPEEESSGSGSSTAKRAMAMLTAGDARFRNPTKAQRRNLAMAFAGQDKIVYGRAFDAVRVPPGVEVDLDELASVELNLHNLTLYEVKSTNRKNLDDFRGYFFALTAAQSSGATNASAQHLSELERALLRSVLF